MLLRGSSFFNEATVPGAHGSLTITMRMVRGRMRFMIAIWRRFKAWVKASSTTDTVTVTSLDGTEQSIEITITFGTNDVPIIGGDVSGSVVEDDALTASGQLSIADEDAGEAFFDAATVPGAHGSLTITRRWFVDAQGR